jgi:hypothetical protein
MVVVVVVEEEERDREAIQERLISGRRCVACGWSAYEPNRQRNRVIGIP